LHLIFYKQSIYLLSNIYQTGRELNMPNSALHFAPMPHIHFGWGVRHSLISHLQKQYSERIVLANPVTLNDEQLMQAINKAL
jgi:hypothetical protein